MKLRINPAIDPAPYARAYAQSKFVQVANIFEPEIADYLEKVLMTLPWRLLCQDDSERNMQLTPAQIAAMPVEQRNQLMNGIAERARRGIGYTYLTYHMIQAALENRDPDHPIHDLTEFLNSAEMLSFAGAVISHSGLSKTDAHATNYQRGHFLTRHTDDGELKERRAAYTLGFSRNWEPDWGGLLVFFDDRGDVLRGFMPRFNVLTIFDGLMPHAVTVVSHFTTAQRLSVAGWFRDDPPATKRTS